MAKRYIECNSSNYEILDLKEKIDSLYLFIESSNGGGIKNV